MTAPSFVLPTPVRSGADLRRGAFDRVMLRCRTMIDKAGLAGHHFAAAGAKQGNGR